MADATQRLSAIPEPAQEPITFQGQKITPGMILRLWRRSMLQKRRSRERILKVRSMRRLEDESLVKISDTWSRKNPEAAEWCREVLEQRITLERDLIARIGVVEPEYTRKPAGYRKRDGDLAEECEAYLEEWRRENVPTQSMFGKATEDGEYGLLIMPEYLDMEGYPEFFDTLDERAYEGLAPEEKAGYKAKEGDRRGRYVKVDDKGSQKVNPKYGAKDDASARKAHDAAVQRYLLDKQASAIRIIPALDCAPIFVRGKQRDRWELVALMERTLYYPEDFLGFEYGAPGLGDRRLIPRAYNADGSRMRVTSDEIGAQGQLYMYTAYLTCKDAKGHVHPIVASTIAGTATWDNASGNPDDPESVIFLDLYDHFKTTRDDGSVTSLETPLWSYWGGLGTHDDDSDHAWQPYLWAFYNRIRAIEGNKTAINAATALNAFTGHYQIIDPKFGEGELAEAIIESDGSLHRPRVPMTGEIESTVGQIVPAQQATVGQDAWRTLQSDMASLQAATAVDSTPGGDGASGHAMVVQSTLAQVAKRAIRESTNDAVEWLGEKHLRILTVIEAAHGIRWPIQTVNERPIGSDMREGTVPAEFDPEWVISGNFRVKAEYPEEENLARVDLESNLQLKGQSTIARLAKAMGEKDTATFRAEMLKDKMWADPSTVLLAQMRLAKATGDKDAQKMLKLKQQQMMSPADLPGVQGGVPAAALRGPGQQGPQPPAGGPTTASSARGGIQAGEMGTASRTADAQAQLQVAPRGAA